MYLSNEEEEYNLSLSRFESMLKTNKVLFFDSEEFENIILHYLDTGKINLAKKALKLGLEQHPNSTGLKLVQVEMLVFEDKLEIADRLLNELHTLEPNNEEIYIQRANIYSKKGMHETAIKFLKIALELTEDYSDVYSLLGMEYLFIDDVKLAKESFIHCLNNDENDQSALYNIVYCFDFLSENREAIEFLNDFIDKEPYSDIAWHQLGRQHLVLKQYNEAVRAFDYATLIDEQFLGAYLEKGKALEKLKKYQEAIDNYMFALELDNQSPYTYMKIGNCHEELGNTEMALHYYKKSLHEDPLLEKGWISLTDFYIKLEKYDKALNYLQKAIDIDDQNEKYWIRYAFLNKGLLRFENSEIGYRKAAELGNYNLTDWASWADILYILGDYYTAISKLLQILENNPDDPEISYRLAVLYFTTSDIEKATFHLTIGLQKDFDKQSIIRDFFPSQWENPLVQNIIRKHNL